MRLAVAGCNVRICPNATGSPTPEGTARGARHAGKFTAANTLPPRRQKGAT